MNKRAIVVGYRYVFGLLTLVAIVVQLMYLYQLSSLNLINFFSYFTNLSNLFASIVFLISAMYYLNYRQPSKTDDIMRGAAVLYMTITGVVYITLLANEDLGALLPWVNLILHFIMPAIVVLDWLIRPPKSKLTIKDTAWWLVFPAGYLIYTLIRGAQVGWYPYPFLNPDNVGGYGGVTVYCLAILAGFIIFGWLLMKLGNLLKRSKN